MLLKINIKRHKAKFEVEVDYAGNIKDFIKLFKKAKKDTIVTNYKTVHDVEYKIEGERTEPGQAYQFIREMMKKLFIGKGYNYDEVIADSNKNFCFTRERLGKTEILQINTHGGYNEFEMLIEGDGITISKDSNAKNMFGGKRTIDKSFYLTNPNLSKEIEEWLELK